MSPKLNDDQFLQILIDDVSSCANAYSRAKKLLDKYVDGRSDLKWEGDSHVPEIRE